MAAKLNQDYGDTVPSKPQNIGLQVDNEMPSGAELVAEGIKEEILSILYFVSNLTINSGLI